MKYFSKTTLGFYELNTGVPNDLVEITDEKWGELLESNSQGKLIQADETGYPIAINPPLSDVPLPTAEEKLALLGLTKEDLKALIR